MDEKIGSEAERSRPFYPNDNTTLLRSIDWKSRYNELKNRKDWDPKTQFVGIKRLGDSYHPLDPFFKFDGVPEGMNTFDRIWLPMFTGVGFTVAMASANWWTRRPFWSSILPTIAFGAFGVWVGNYAWTSSRRRARERDAVLVHYMILHENEFPIIERKRFGQILKAWEPIRPGNDGLLVDKTESFMNYKK